MPAAARAENTDTIETGHLCDTTAKIAGILQSSVYVNNKLGAVKGDAIAPHTILSGSSCVPHSAVVNAGSGSVFFEGIEAARVGDSADAGTIITGSGSVFIGN